jgi:SAM-dependent methyltransferase
VSDPNLHDEYFYSAQFYDNVERYTTRPDVDFYVQSARESGGPVLELGCGTGRVLIPTARAGLAVTGLDASPAMLAICRDKLGAEPDEVRARVALIQGDMRSFDLGKIFALAVTPFRPFQHLLTVEDQLACLECVRRHLALGGRFILDVFNPWLESLVRKDEGETWEDEAVRDLPDGRRVVRRNRVLSRDLTSQIIRSELLYDVTHPDGREERLVQPLALRYLFRFEAEHLLARAGFAVESVYGNYDRSPFGRDYPGELILMTRKT